MPVGLKIDFNLSLLAGLVLTEAVQELYNNLVSLKNLRT